MALPVLDGNQSATTLSSVVTGGEHIVAHSVVSLGSTAISNITSAVSGSVVTIPSLARIANSAATDGIADTTLNFIKIGGHQDGSNQTAHIVHVSAGGAMKVDATDSSVTFGAVRGTVTISNFPSTQTIAGTVTANLSNTVTATWKGAIGSSNAVPIVFAQEGQAGGSAISYDGSNTSLNVNVKGSLPAISGTVTANVFNGTISYVSAILDGEGNTFGLDRDFPISGTVTVGNSVTIGSVPNGSLTTRFGTPTTANTAFATSAVTNASRKYLLIQNVTTGSNVITVGIGFTPTTTQGIQLTAGAGITFESSYIPTGAVYVLSSVTASNFTILEA